MSVQYKDYYEILGVPRTASESEIKKAYRELAKKYHPDVSKEKGAEVRYKEINEAYEVLKDKDKRQKYDTLGMDWQSGQDFTPPPGWQNMGGGFGGFPGGFSGGMGGFSDFFRLLFGGAPGGFPGGHSASSGGVRAAESELTLSLEDIVRGGTHTLIMQSPAGGRRNVNVNLPRGVKDGSKIRIPSGAGGDVNVTIRIAPHDVFTAGGYDLTREIRVAPWDAVLGGEISVETLSGTVAMKIKPGTQDGQKLRLRGKGLPKRAAGENGDMFVVVRIDIPKTVTERQKELWRELKSCG